jgi:hypothetical protein
MLKVLHHIKRFNTELQLGDVNPRVNQAAFRGLASVYNNLVALPSARPDQSDDYVYIPLFGEGTASTKASIQLFDLMVPRGMRRITSLADDAIYWGNQSVEDAALVNFDGDAEAQFAWLQLAAHIIPPMDGIDREPIPTSLSSSCTNGPVSCSRSVHTNLVEVATAPLQYFAVEWDYSFYLQFSKFKSQLAELKFFKDRPDSEHTVRMVPCFIPTGTIFWTPIEEEQYDDMDIILKTPASQDLMLNDVLHPMEQAGIFIADADRLYLCAG